MCTFCLKITKYILNSIAGHTKVDVLVVCLKKRRSNCACSYFERCFMELKRFKDACCEGLDEEALFEVVALGLNLLNTYNQEFKENLSWRRSILFDIKDELSSSVNEGASVNLVKSDEIYKMLSYGVTKYKREPEQHPKRTFRLPGVVFCRSSVIEIVEKINEVKSWIQFVVCKSTLHERQRIKFFSRRFGANIVLKELYRQITVFNTEISSLSFTWAKNVPQTLIVTKDSVLDSLYGELADASKDRVALIKRDLEILANLCGEGTFKRARKIPPHPRCNIVCSAADDYSKPKRLLRHAHLPIFINSDLTSPESCLVRPLCDIDLVSRTSERPNGMDGFEQIIERLDLYYKP